MTSTVLKSIAQRAAKFCSADNVQIHVVDGAVLRCVAHHGSLSASAGREPIPISPDLVAGKAVLSRQTIQLRDLAGRSGRKRSGRARDGYHSILVAPLMRDGAAIGSISLGRKQTQPFSDEQVELLNTLADLSALTIENARLSTDVQEHLEQQSATSEILRVISSSPTDLQAVLDAVAENAARVCNATDALILRVQGNGVAVAAQHGSIPL